MSTHTKRNLSSVGVAAAVALLVAFAVVLVGTILGRNPASAQSTVAGVGDGTVDWGGWQFTYDNPPIDGDDRFDGLTLGGVSYDGLHVLEKASLPVMNVFYEANACGPYSDRLGGGNIEPPTWREFTVDDVTWLEIGVEAQIGAYFIYQAYYFSESGLMDMHIFSGGIQCPNYHEHLPFLRLDFDIGADRYVNDQIRRVTPDGEVTEAIEFDLPASAATGHQWRVVDAGTGDYVSIAFDDGSYQQQIDGPIVPESDYDNNFVYGRTYKVNEEIWAPIDANLNLTASRTVPGNELENIDGTGGGDPVLWYTGYMPHDPDTEVAELWHSTGIRLEVHPAAAQPSPAAQPTTCAGLAVTVDLSLGDEPTDGDDVILGTPLDDTIAARAGNDIVCGADGDDVIWGQDGDDQLIGGDGDDKLRGGDGDDRLLGEAGADDLNGGRGDDQVVGGGGDDSKLRGGTGDDYVDGGPGDDALVSGNGGADVVIGGAGADKLVGGPRPDDLFGDDGDDELRGLGGADILFAGAGDDQLFGGKQSDSLHGGPGTDTCSGGTTGSDAPEADETTDCEELSAVP